MSQTLTYQYTGTLEITECANCHMEFGISPAFIKQRRNDHQSFYCPNGHSLSFSGKSEAQKLAEELAREKKYRGWSESALTAARDQLGATERSLVGHKAAKTRLKNRIAAGVCPCCNRTFQNVAAHMSGQHPDFAHKADSSTTKENN